MNETMKEEIRALLEDHLPLVDFESDFLYENLDSLGVTTIQMLLTEKYNITIDAADATPRNFKSLDAIVAMVESKLNA